MVDRNKEINIPVTILCGFLGSGKTTLLNHLLDNNDGIRYAIIENEFGEQGIDNELVLHPNETIIELNNGCLCCTLNDNIYDILNELIERKNDFDEIIIEATGVADPTGIAQPFVTHPAIKKHFPLTSIICLVDAELIEDYLSETEEAINQVLYSDILLINKIDLVSPQHVSSLELKLQALNPLASIIKGHKGDLPKIEYKRTNEKLEQVLLENHTNHESKAEELIFPVEKPHHHFHHNHTKEINSITFKFNTPFDVSKLQIQLTIYLTFQSKQLYRMKGLIWIENDENQYILQSVGRRFDLKEKREWQNNEEKQSVIVFIGKKLQREGIERMLKSCLSKSRTRINKPI